jgi:hypothetical protein
LSFLFLLCQACMSHPKKYNIDATTVSMQLSIFGALNSTTLQSSNQLAVLQGRIQTTTPK